MCSPSGETVAERMRSSASSIGPEIDLPVDASQTWMPYRVDHDKMRAPSGKKATENQSSHSTLGRPSDIRNGSVTGMYDDTCQMQIL